MTPTFPLLENYLSYMEAALGRSENTVKEYRYDLILFARFLKLDRGLVPQDTPLEEIDMIFSPSLSGSQDRENSPTPQEQGILLPSRAFLNICTQRKGSSITIRHMT